MMKLVRMSAICAVLLGAAAPLAAQPILPGTATIQPDDQSELQWAAGVTQITELPATRAEAHLFGVTGGDPAMNGLTTYLSFFQSPADGHKIFRVGDFLDYSVVSQAPGRIVLTVRENFMRGRSGTIAVRMRRLTVTWRAAAGQAPNRITIASAPGR